MRTLLIAMGSGVFIVIFAMGINAWLRPWLQRLERAERKRK